MTTSTPAAASAQSRGTTATVSPARDRRVARNATWACDGTMARSDPARPAVNCTADSRAGI